MQQAVTIKVPAANPLEATTVRNDVQSLCDKLTAAQLAKIAKWAKGKSAAQIDLMLKAI